MFLLGATLFVAAPGSAQRSLGPGAPEPFQDLVAPPAGVLQGGRVSLQDAVSIATSRVPGRVVRAETVDRNGRRVHEVLIRNDEGVVRTVRVDAESGTVR